MLLHSSCHISSSGINHLSPALGIILLAGLSTSRVTLSNSGHIESRIIFVTKLCILQWFPNAYRITIKPFPWPVTPCLCLQLPLLELSPLPFIHLRCSTGCTPWKTFFCYVPLNIYSGYSHCLEIPSLPVYMINIYSFCMLWQDTHKSFSRYIIQSLIIPFGLLRPITFFITAYFIPH